MLRSRAGPGPTLILGERVRIAILDFSTLSELCMLRSTSSAEAALCHVALQERLAKRQRHSAGFSHDQPNVRSVAVAAAARRLRDTSSQTRCCAMQGLSKLARKGNGVVVDQLLWCARSPDAGVRLDALRLLPKYVHADQEILDALMNNCGFNSSNYERLDFAKQFFEAAESSLLELAATHPESAPVMIIYRLASHYLKLNTIGHPGTRQRSTEKVLRQLAHIGGGHALHAMHIHLGPAYMKTLRLPGTVA